MARKFSYDNAARFIEEMRMYPGGLTPGSNVMKGSEVLEKYPKFKSATEARKNSKKRNAHRAAIGLSPVSEDKGIVRNRYYTVEQYMTPAAGEVTKVSESPSPRNIAKFKRALTFIEIYRYQLQFGKKRGLEIYREQTAQLD